MPAPLPTAPPSPARRVVRYTLYLSPEELATLRKRAAASQSQGVSAYIRETALRRAPPAAIPTVNREAYVALARLAGNLNQIAHHLNAGNAVTAELGRQLSGQVAEVAELVRRLRLDIAGAR